MELKKKIDDFNSTCSILELMANNAMKKRHWNRMSALCDYNFDVESKDFTVKNVLEAPLLKHKNDVEVCKF